MKEGLAEICRIAAAEGARVLRDRYDRPRTVDHKGRIDLVTDADRASEEAVLRKLREFAPGVAVLAEESGESGSTEEPASPATGGARRAEHPKTTRFIVDPLDGTTNYAHGLPMFCCTVAVQERGEVVAGATIDPMRDEVFHAARGQGAWLGEKRIHVSATSELLQALLCTGFPYGQGPDLADMIRSFGYLTGLSRGVRRLGSAAMDLAYVACGRLDGFWERGLHAWDVAAGKVLVEEAGGMVSRFDGSPLDIFGGEIAASGRSLHAAILRELRASTSAR